MDRMPAIAVLDDGRHIRIEGLDGTKETLSALWLRDLCSCAQCVQPNSSQRLTDPLTLDMDLRAISADLGGDGTVDVLWSDGHAGRFGLHQLEAALGGHHVPARPSLWGAEITQRIPIAEYEDVRTDDRALRDLLDAIDRYGFALLHGVPAQDSAIARVVDLFGFVRETNYGRVFDVRSTVNPANLANSSLALGPHTDNPYRDPTPTLQLLHCLSSDVEGGDTTLVDGFRVAEEVRRLYPALFKLLCGVPLAFRYTDGDTDLRAEVPVITRVGGETTAIRFNSRSRAQLPARMDGFAQYAEAYRTFARLLAGEDLQVVIHLDPGDAVIMDNLRVLHGRTGFSGAGNRWLQGCYADRDGLRSRLAVLNRALENGSGSPSRGETVIDEIFRLFHTRGDGAYVGEPVSMTEHMLQTAAFAEQDGASQPLVAAALLHDIGHLLHDMPEDVAEDGIDTRHEELAHEFLSRHFMPEVAEAARMHVEAKRYLCAVDPTYLAALSPASQLSLQLQGGPFSPEEVAAFERSPFATSAVALRRYDDLGKIEGMRTPDLEHYRSVLVDSLKPVTIL